MYEMFTDSDPMRSPDFSLPADGLPRTHVPISGFPAKGSQRKPYCYQCEALAEWLAPDGRCGKCTRYTPEEVRGE